MPNLYIIAGCNGAGKTTGSLAILPRNLDCIEFINADIIAYGLSPLNVESVAIEAGKIMLNRMNQLMEEGIDFAFETTLATKSYAPFIKKAKDRGYKITLLYFWLESPAMARSRVAIRVAKGGHNIPSDVIERRYYRGIKNLHELYIPICNDWVIINNTSTTPEWIAYGLNSSKKILNYKIWNIIMEQQLLAEEPEITYYNKGAEDKLNRIMSGLREGCKKLVIESAARGESLVVLKDGRVQHVPAKELLKEFDV